MEIPNEKQICTIKKEMDYLVQTEIYIKTEPEKDESEFLVTAGNSSDICNGYDIKIETVDPIANDEYDELSNESMQDPLKIDEDDYKKYKMNVNEDEGLCLLKINEETVLSSLIRNQHVGKNKTHTCPVCHKIFRLKSGFDVHFRIHTGEKPFACHICQKLHIQKTQLNEHMLIHTGIKPHVCDVCKKAFRRKTYLNVHKVIHSDVQFSCDKCEKSYKRKEYLILHQQKHTGYKPFACECGKSFYGKQNLNRHKLLHSAVKPFPCDICPKRFTIKSVLKTHKKMHTN